MRRPRHAALVDKAIDACIAAIEIYNKPDFRDREEAFSILMFNAWELLLKARVLRENKGDQRSIELWEPVKRQATAMSDCSIRATLAAEESGSTTRTSFPSLISTTCSSRELPIFSPRSKARELLESPWIVGFGLSNILARFDRLTRLITEKPRDNIGRANLPHHA